MSYTQHGHQIPGTGPDVQPPHVQVRCGGITICQQCKGEVIQHLIATGQHFEGVPSGIQIIPITDLRAGGPNIGDGLLNVIDQMGRGIDELPPASDERMYFDIVDEHDYPQAAKDTLREYLNIGKKLGDPGYYHIEEVYIVWFCKTLQNWKVLLSTVRSDGRYYELTYNGDKEELYIDTYGKISNAVLHLSP